MLFLSSTIRNFLKSLHYFALITLLATVFMVDSRLVNGVVSGKYFFLYIGMGLFNINILIHLLITKITFRFSLTDGFLLLFSFSVFFAALALNDASANSSKLTIFALLLVLYFCLRCVFDSAKQDVQRLICFLIVLTGLIEAVWGMMQLHDLKPSQHNLFKLTGSFFNPGQLAGYIAVVFPLALYFFWEKNNQQIIKWLSGITCIAIFMVIPATMSRASWLAVIAGSIVVIAGRWRKERFFLKSGKKSLKILALIMALCLSGAAVFGMYYLKKSSADGRLLTWKVSVAALVKNPLGVGLGHFPGAYGEAQAAYFASGKASANEEYVAGNPEYGFNEYLQIGIESGVLSLLLFIGMMICAFRGLVKTKNWGMTGSLAALLVFACFSYPFSVLPFLIVLVFLLAISAVNSAQISADRKSAPVCSISAIGVPIICMAVTAFCLWKQYPVYDAYRQWKQNKRYYGAGMYEEVVMNYGPLYPRLNDQIHFLFEYGRSLSQLEQPEKSNEILRRAMKISCDPMLYNIMGKNYQMMKEYGLAEEYLQKSMLIAPNRIYPYYLLMNLHIETGDREKALANAKIVLTKEPKVQSQAVNEMRAEARKMFEN